MRTECCNGVTAEVLGSNPDRSLVTSSNVADVFVDEGSCLVAEVHFADFAEAFAFVSKVAAVAEAACHHPDIEIRWNRVRLSLTTHDAGGVVTKQDRALAHDIEELLS